MFKLGLVNRAFLPGVSTWMGKVPFFVQSGRKRPSVAWARQCRQMSEDVPTIQSALNYCWQPGSGDYDDSLGKTGRLVNDMCEDFLLSYIDSVPVPSEGGVFTIGDYGACDGFASQQLIHKIIAHLRTKHGPDLNIQVLYEDQPSNNFNGLFRRVYDKKSYMSKFSKVFPLACGTSFYNQCVPDNFCDIIISTVAAHWLSEECAFPCPDSIFPMLSASKEEMQVFQKNVERDWEKFLLHRAAELKPGGLLFVVQNLKSTVKPTQSSSETTPVQEGPKTFNSAQYTFLSFDSSWKDLYKQGLITQEEFEAFTLWVTTRTIQETKAPFENTVRCAGLCLLQEPEEIVLPFMATQLWRQKLEKDGVDDRDYFADLLTKELLFWSEAVIRNSLMKTRTEAEQSAIIKQLFQTHRGKAASVDPNRFYGNLSMSRIIAQKSIQHR